MTAVDADRNVNFLQRHRFITAHIAVIGLHKELACCASRSHASTIFEEPSVAGIGSIPERIVGLLRLRELRVVCWEVGLEVHCRTEYHARIEFDYGLLY